MKILQKTTRILALSAALSLASMAQAHNEASEASALSALPVAVSVAAPSMVLSAGVVLTVVSVQVVAGATVWVVQRASDGARMVIRWGSQAAGVASVALGTAVTVTAISAGYILSAAGQAIAFVPNALGASLLYNERFTD
ncbi:MAG: hypothetical protein Q7V20_00585 [Aquabacterium sp.]|uniref:hypothetical protein n=1 Tax=Aquabacterium sp. TaxID=1872578 RepID=UPI002723C53A|nr:hypothetical protein [Aquabacterium sp.]MDO9001926.1 hypothetical protein [Aquabacterium sp.]